MNIKYLDPYPGRRENFHLKRQQFVPDTSGCYVLTSHIGNVLYIGRTTNLRRRLGNHLDDPEKTSPTKNGRAMFFYWLACDELQKIERTWLNTCEIKDGVLPILNKVASSIST